MYTRRLFSLVSLCFLLSAFTADLVFAQNTLDYFRQQLQGKEVFLKTDVVFGKLWTGVRKDVTNVMEDGVWYRSYGIANRDPNIFIETAVNNRWGNPIESNYTPNIMFRGERVKIYKIERKSEQMLVVYLRAESKLKTGVFFDFRKDSMNVPVEEADMYIRHIFAFSQDELDAEETRTVSVGMTVDEVKRYAGLPKAQLEPEAGVLIFIYDGFKVIFRDGIVERIDY